MNIFNSFFYATVRLQANLAAFELSTDVLQKKYQLDVEILDINNDNHVATWCDIINHSYSEFNYDIRSAREFLKDEKYYYNRETYLFKDNLSNNKNYCATVSIAQYVASPKVGGDFKIGVKKDFQGKGLGRLVILYAFSRLKERDLEVGESSIFIKRKTSLYLHFKLGFKPQYNPNNFALPASSRLYRIIKVIPLLQLKHIYSKFIKSENKKFKTK